MTRFRHLIAAVALWPVLAPDAGAGPGAPRLESPSPAASGWRAPSIAPAGDAWGPAPPPDAAGALSALAHMLRPAADGRPGGLALDAAGRVRLRAVAGMEASGGGLRGMLRLDLRF